MKIRRILSMAMCLVLALALLAGCGSSTGNQVQNSSATVETTAASAPEEPVKLVYVRPYWGNVGNDNEGFTRIREIIKQKINVDVEVIGQANPTDQQEKFNLMMASGEQIDIASLPMISSGGVNNLRKFADEGVIIPVDDLLKTNGQGLLENMSSETWPYFRYNGKTWAAGCYEYVPNTTNFFIRKDWLDKEGLKVPETIEEYESVMLALKEKRNSQGFIQLWDYIDQIFVGSFVPVGANNFMDEDGKIKPWFLHKGYKDYLATMQKWYKEGILHKELFTMKYEQAYDLIVSGKAASSHAWLSGWTFLEPGIKVDPDYDLVALKPLKGTYQGSFPTSPPAADMVVITKMCKYPEKAMDFINFTGGTPEGYMLAYFGENDVDSKYTLQPDGRYSKDTSFVPAIKLEDTYNSYLRTVEPLKFQFSLHYLDKINNERLDRDWYPLINNPEMPLTKGAEFGMYFDVNAMKSKDMQATLTPMINEARAKIIMGLLPVDDWDKVIEKWYADGGNVYIEDMIEQYNAWKAE